MKRLALTFMFLVLLGGGLSAQNDPFGEVDTLYLDQLTVGAGREFTINVNLWNDDELGGITIPLAYPTDKLELPEIIFAGGRIDYIDTKPVAIDQTAGTILVGAIVFLEDFIAPGDGPLFKLKFKIKDDVLPGEIITIDTTQIPPAFLLLTHSDATNIIPYVRPGKINVTEENRPPVFAPVPEIHIAEGESLYVDLAAIDPDGDPVSIANPVHPINSQFSDNGDGTARFAWRPDYVGPTSSEQSPFEFVFRVSDGAASSTIPVTVNIFNVNRAPQITAPPMVQGEAGDSLEISVQSLDPDFENVVWGIDGLPSGATFDFDNPGLINWVTGFADSGVYQITLTATDPAGMADTSTLEIDLASVALYNLTIDTLTSFSGRIVDVDIFLENKFDVAEFDLLIHFDPALLAPLDVFNDDSRTEHFEFFEYRLNDAGNMGDVRIMGRADIAGEPTGAPIPSGEGVIFRVSVQVSPNLSYVGSYIPIRFETRVPGDNVLIDGEGNSVEKEQVNLFDGSILIASPGPTILGDINLNGLAFEISDAVYFSNFFISPGQYPFNDQQLLNSDINQDGYAPSVADLVMMIQVISGEIPPPSLKREPSTVTVVVSLTRNVDGLYLTTDSPVDIAGAFFELHGPEIDRIYPVNLTGMDLLSGLRQNQMVCLMMSYTRETISFGEVAAIKLSDNPDLDVSLGHVELADTEGRVLQIDFKENPAVPDKFALYQNVPNPFNPATQIRFDLEAAVHVTLTVYNVLGQEVIRLADREFPAGSHTVTWDGSDGNGRAAASGIYLYRIEAGDMSAGRKMLLMK